MAVVNQDAPFLWVPASPFYHSTLARDFDKWSEAEGTSGHIWVLPLKRPATSPLMSGSFGAVCKPFKCPEADFCKEAHRNHTKAFCWKYKLLTSPPLLSGP